MNRYLFTFLTTALCALMAGCGSSSGGGSDDATVDNGVTPQEFHEEDDSIAEANVQGDAAEGTDLNGFAELSDDDYYRIQVPSGSEQVQASLSFSSATADLDLSLVDASNSVVAFSAGATDTESISYRVSGPGAYYLLVTSRSGSAEYVLRWSASAPPAPSDDDAHEEDDTIAEADARGDFAASTSFDGFCQDDDYFRIVVPAGQEVVEVLLDFDSDAADLDMEFLSGTGELIKGSYSFDTEELTVLATSPGVHYLRVFPFSGSESYSLTWTASVPPPDDDHEEDDSFTQADARGDLAAGMTFSGMSLDDDYFRIVVPAGEELVEASLDFDSSVADLDLDLYSASGDFIEGAATSDTDAITLVVPQSGVYYLHVLRFSGFGPYALSWSSSIPPPDDAHEEDDSFSEADAQIDLVADSDFSGMALDDDYFRIVVPAGEELIEVSLDFDSSVVDLDLDIYSAGENLLDTAATLETETLTIVVPSSGVHYLRVVRYAGIGPYTLSWSSSTPPPEDGHEEDDSLSEADAQGPFDQGITANGMCIDSDYYRIVVQPGQENVSVTVDFDASEADLDVRFYDGSGSVIESSLSVEAPEIIRTEVPAAGVYYIEVYPFRHFGAYTLTWSGSAPETPTATN